MYSGLAAVAVAFVCVITCAVIVTSVIIYKRRCDKLTRSVFHEESMKSQEQETRLELLQQSRYDTFSKLDHIVQSTNRESLTQPFQDTETSIATLQSPHIVSLGAITGMYV